MAELSRKVTDINEGDQSKPAFPKQAEKATKSILKAKGVSNNNRGPLMKATISTLFKKVENKVGETIEKGSSAEGKRTDGSLRWMPLGYETMYKNWQEDYEAGGETDTEDDIEEFSSCPQDTESSDEDFVE